VGPSHCTGEEAMAILKRDFGENYIPLGVGKEILIR
jgi:metal-dependent hydrolase (beta-lactamase superfamily II)